MRNESLNLLQQVCFSPCEVLCDSVFGSGVLHSPVSYAQGKLNETEQKWADALAKSEARVERELLADARTPQRLGTVPEVGSRRGLRAQDRTWEALFRKRRRLGFDVLFVRLHVFSIFIYT